MNNINKSGIPNEVIVDILSRLPLEAVLRFKIASKTWYLLICDPSFINLHSKRFSHNRKLVLLSIADESDLARSELNLLLSSNISRISEPVEFPKKEYPLQPYKIIGSSLGLVCVATDYCRNFYLWNPITRESKKIPNMDNDKIEHYDYIHGLGYDSVTNDFKVVISFYPILYTKKRVTFDVFSLKNYSWKQIISPFRYFYNPVKFSSEWQFRMGSYGATESLFKNYGSTTLATVLTGVFHWIVRVPNENDPQIIAFDSTKETFHKLYMPKEKSLNGWLYGHCGILCLMEHNGCLCLLCSNGELEEIWMMKEYRNSKSWIHLLSISILDSYIVKPTNICKPLCIFQKNNLVFHTHNEIISWIGVLKDEKLSERETLDRCRSSGYDMKTLCSKYIMGSTLLDATLVSPHDFTCQSSIFMSTFV